MIVALLVGTVAVFGIFMVALKPSSSSKSGAGGVGPYQSAIDKAKQAVATSSTASQAQGGTVATTPSGSAPTASTPAATPTTTSTTASASSAASSTSSAAAQRLSSVEQALAQHKVVAVLVYNPAATDDQAVKQELAAVPTYGGNVVKLDDPALRARELLGDHKSGARQQLAHAGDHQPLRAGHADRRVR